MPAGATYDGLTAETLASRLRVPRAVVFDSIGSVLDAAHDLGRGGAPAGTVVLADQQTAGRGRAGRKWSSPPASGIWLALLERPEASALAVLSLRLGLRAAPALDPFATAPVQLKWPNDISVLGRKLAGILTEVRWREDEPEWVAIGFGLNVRQPADLPTAAGLRAGVARLDVLAALVPALREAAAARGPLTAVERASFDARDMARGARCLAPAAGVASGITAEGDLVVQTATGAVRCRAGSLVLEGGGPDS